MRKTFVAICLLLAMLPLVGCGGGEKKTSYDIDAEYFPAEDLLRCEMTVNAVNRTENALTSLPFQLWANAYREGAKYAPVSELYAPAAYYEGESYGDITVKALTGAAFTIGGEDENILYAALPEPLYPDESVSLTFSFEVKLAHVDHRLGVGEHNVNLANFYPILCAYRAGGFYETVYSENGDPFVSECADYDVTLTVPASYTVAGAVLNEEGGGKRVFTLKAENVRDVAFVLGEHLDRVDATACGIPVTYYYIEDESPEKTLRAACDSLACFHETFGAYAYPAYTVVQTDFPYGGMEYPMLSMISSSLQTEQIPAVVAHETAHQWWYAMVGSNQFEEAWQDEGLAEWSAAYFLKCNPLYGDYRETVAASERSYRAFFSVSAQIKGEADTRMSRPLTAYTGLYEYRNVAYDKGVILFDRIMDVAGEKTLIKGLRNYVAKYGGKIAEAGDLVSCLDAAGAHAEELVRSFTEGKCVI